MGTDEDQDDCDVRVDTVVHDIVYIVYAHDSLTLWVVCHNHNDHHGYRWRTHNTNRWQQHPIDQNYLNNKDMDGRMK